MIVLAAAHDRCGASVRIELHLPWRWRWRGSRCGRPAGIFVMHRRGRGTGGLLGKPRCRGKRRHLRGVLRLVLAAHAERGEPLEQRATAGLGRAFGRRLATLRANLLLDRQRQVLDLRHARRADRLLRRRRDERAGLGRVFLGPLSRSGLIMRTRRRRLDVHFVEVGRLSRF